MQAVTERKMSGIHTGIFYSDRSAQEHPMKTPIHTFSILAAVAAASALTGCAVPAQQRYARAQPVNPYEWHTVSVTPVAPGSRPADGASRVEYTTEEFNPAPAPARVEYTTEPVYPASNVYVAPPLYAPAPAYYYPPVTLGIGLDFVFGRWGGGGHRRYYGRRH